MVCTGDHIGAPTCTQGVCGGECESGFEDCDGDKQTNGCEIDTGTDVAHCGACGAGCSTDHVPAPACTGGACSGACEPGWVDCDGDKQANGCETDTAADPGNCGGCGLACSADHITPACVAGSCDGACEPGWVDCDGDKLTNGCEANLPSDPDNCGGCGLACSSNHVLTPTCSGGVCSGACDAGFADCNADKQLDGCEAATGTDVANCGGCGNACSSNHVASPTCTGGTCTGPCSAGFADCDGDKQTNGCEAFLAGDPDNCGGCGIVCSWTGMATRTCVNGVCAGTCAPESTDCDGNKQIDGCETAVGTDPLNCGGCGVMCSANHVSTPACSAGSCNGACDAGFASCDGNMQANGCETSTNADPSNCGGCGQICSNNHIASPTCAAGACNGACDAGFADCDGNKKASGCEANLLSGITSCGGCGIACSGYHMATVTCAGGVCNGACAPGYSDCDADKQTNGCESASSSDPDNCGGCGVVCSSAGMATRTCSGGVCNGICAAGFTDCDGNKQANGCEVNTGADASNCGACNKVCSPNNMAAVTCSGGVCNGACAAGFADCDGNKQTNGCEKNITADTANCGGCGKVCSANNVSPVTCSSGVCSGSCVGAFLDCDNNKQTNGCEVNPATDANNCSGCGVVCSNSHMATRTCSAGVCNGTCATGYSDCDANKQTNGCEQDVYGSPSNCGGCGLNCSNNNVPVPACAVGVCSGACASGTSNCDGNKGANGCETFTSTDPSNCGGCGLACSSNHMASVTCSNNACDGACASGYDDCNGNKQLDGCESDPIVDPDNCGACGVACSNNHMATRTCTASTCSGTCGAGYADCDGNKLSNGCETNTNTDPNSCGNCGNVCGAGLQCVNGACTTCNPAVLLLADSSSAINTALKNALDAAGVPTTLVTGGVATYANVPAASSFGAILIPVGNAYGTTMPAAGQTAIVNAYNAGAGVVLTEWAAYNVQNNNWTTLAAVLLVSRTAGISGNTGPYTLTSAGHPVWDGLPMSFTAISQSANSGNIIAANGGVSIATSGGTTAGVVVKDAVGGKGRIVQIPHAASYNNVNWVSDANLRNMFVNAAKWAGRCL